VNKAFLFGTGLGIAIGEQDLELSVVRVRPGGPHMLATATVKEFRTRPAAEWGTELLGFLGAAGEPKLSATVLLPRSEVIVRTLQLPGVAAKELQAAIELQIDTLNPFGDEEIAWAWAPCRNSVLIGLVRQTVLAGYETLFAEAGISIAAVTFSAAVLYPALRLWNADTTALPILAYRFDGKGRMELYGESEARAVYSAEFPEPLSRALAIARAELRLTPETSAQTFLEILPKQAETTDFNALAYAAAIAGAVPKTTKLANLLPEARRAVSSRLQWIIPAAIAAALAIAAIVVFGVFPALDEQRYTRELLAEAKNLEPTVARVKALEARAGAEEVRVAALDQFRGRPQADLEVLNELTRLLPTQVWTNAIEIYPDSVVIAGEADQAAPLLKVLDSSPLFQNSEFGLSVTRNQNSEQFRIKTMRRGRAGRTTP